MQNWALYANVRPLDDFEGPLDFCGHGSWSMCWRPLEGVTVEIENLLLEKVEAIPLHCSLSLTIVVTCFHNK